MVTLTQAKEHKIFEVSGTRPVRNFLMAIGAKEPSLADVYLNRLKQKKQDDLFEIIENYRQQIHLQQTHQSLSKGSHSAFVTSSTLQKRQKTPDQPSSSGGATVPISTAVQQFKIEDKLPV